MNPKTISRDYISSKAATADELDQRISEFKDNEENMELIRKFVDEVLLKAEEEANRRRRQQQQQQQEQQQLDKLEEQKLQKQQENNSKISHEEKGKSTKASFSEFNSQVGNLARVYVVRMFDAICNCANNAAAAPIPRFKFRNNKKTTTTTTTTTNTTNTNTNTTINTNDESNDEKMRNDSFKFKSDLINTIKLTKKNTTNGKMKKSDKNKNKLLTNDINQSLETIELNDKI